MSVTMEYSMKGPSTGIVVLPVYANALRGATEEELTQVKAILTARSMMINNHVFTRMSTDVLKRIIATKEMPVRE